MYRKLYSCLLGLGVAAALCAAGPQGAPKPAPPAGAATAKKSEPDEKSALNKKHLEEYIRHLYGWPAQVKVEIGPFTASPMGGMLQTTVVASYGQASQEKIFFVTADGKHIIDGAIYDAADNPFRANLSKITTALQPSFGAPGASVVVVDFSDFQCPHCREEAKALRDNILKTYPNQVRVYFKDFPLANHDWALAAAMAGRCIFRQNPLAFWEYHDWVFDKQGEITAANFAEKLNGFTQGKEVDPLQLNRCIEKRETEEEVKKSTAEGRALGITSTPTLFVNGRKVVGNTPWPNLKQMIDLEIEYQKTAKNAGEQECCEVKLPSVVKP